MTTEQKALALVKKARHFCASTTLDDELCRDLADELERAIEREQAAIEAHEADKKAFSDALKAAIDGCGHNGIMAGYIQAQFASFILPEPEPDPLVDTEDPIDALVDLLAPVLTHSQGMAARERENRFRNAIAALRAKEADNG